MAERVSEIQSSIEFLSSKYDSVISNTEANQAEITRLHTEVSSLSSTVVAQAELLDKLRSEVNDLEQYSRKCNFEVHGLPYKPNEDLRSIMTELAQNLGISDFQPTAITAIHRLPSKTDSIPPILVQTSDVASKDKWLGAKKGLSSLAQTGSFPRLYFNENLTRHNKDLFRLTRLKGKEKGFKFVWTKNGKIFAKKCEGASLIRVEREYDLEKIC
ncbi:hypothetical protein HPB50_004400 [Hyalomma asiaticum]|uniref:Uncharacterized protein n=1 Tax=Hyalomma asiaticum TaxID=266040 RepID=A0ACB7RNA0_HYAAI|nr:hypothetical protein HPB50_004400 [Hyalomma asiaticum]